jgi:hypothetical protein
MKIHLFIHVSLLEPYQTPTTLRQCISPSSPIEVNDNLEHKIDERLDSWLKQHHLGYLTPKRPNVPGVTKLVLGSVTWPHFILDFLKLFVNVHESCNKLCGSTNFIIFGPTDQKLWMFEVFRRSLGRAGMCWSQPARVHHMRKKWRTGGRNFFLQRLGLGHPARTS